MMDHERAKDIIIERLRRGVVFHQQGQFSNIGEGYDELDVSFPRDSCDLGIAWNFWDSWIDESSHGFPGFYKGVSRENWPNLALYIIDKLSKGEKITEPLILSNFKFDKNQPLPIKLKKIFKRK
jgi:hypothetical protein